MKTKLGPVLAFLAASLCGQAVKAAPKTPPALAQKLVESAVTRNPQLAEVGIAVKLAGACKTIASTDVGDLGEACEAEDLAAIASGKATTQKDRDSYEISLPLHDSAGRLVGALGLEFKPNPALNPAAVLTLAQAVAAGLEKQIPSQAALLAPGR